MKQKRIFLSLLLYSFVIFPSAAQPSKAATLKPLHSQQPLHGVAVSPRLSSIAESPPTQFRTMSSAGAADSKEKAEAHQKRYIVKRTPTKKEGKTFYTATVTDTLTGTYFSETTTYAVDTATNETLITFNTEFTPHFSPQELIKMILILKKAENHVLSKKLPAHLADELHAPFEEAVDA